MKHIALITATLLFATSSFLAVKAEEFPEPFGDYLAPGASYTGTWKQLDDKKKETGKTGKVSLYLARYKYENRSTLECCLLSPDEPPVAWMFEISDQETNDDEFPVEGRFFWNYDEDRVYKQETAKPAKPSETLAVLYRYPIGVHKEGGNIGIIRFAITEGGLTARLDDAFLFDFGKPTWVDEAERKKIGGVGGLIYRAPEKPEKPPKGKGVGGTASVTGPPTIIGTTTAPPPQPKKRTWWEFLTRKEKPKIISTTTMPPVKKPETEPEKETTRPAVPRTKPDLADVKRNYSKEELTRICKKDLEDYYETIALGYRMGTPDDPENRAKFFLDKIVRDNWKNGVDMMIPEAQVLLGICYYEGGGMMDRRDREKAADLFRRAAEQGNAWGQVSLGRYYYRLAYGSVDTGDKNAEEAAKWFRKAAAQGNAEAQHRLALYYYEVDYPKKHDHPSYIEAFKWWRKAAEQGHAIAQGWLEHCYSAEIGTKEDLEAANIWKEKAEEQKYRKEGEVW